jgi:hypothetical protein
MPFTNRSDLKDSLRSWLMRPGDTTHLADSTLNDVITMQEAETFERLDLNDIETNDPAFAVSSGLTALPTGFKGFRRDPIASYQGSSYNLTLSSPAQITDETGGRTGTPRLYCIEANKLRLGFAPAEALTLDITYWGKPAAITDSASNIVLDTYPNIYLFGSLKFCAPYIGEDGRLAMWEKFYEQAVAIAQSAARKKKWATGGEMRVAGPTP